MRHRKWYDTVSNMDSPMPPGVGSADMDDPLHNRPAERPVRAGVPRRGLLLGLMAAACAAGAVGAVAARALQSRLSPAADDPSLADWRTFQDRFVTPEGRVVDTGNHGVTHSEGQGYGMLFAEHFGDRESLDRLHAWTQQNLKRPDDALHAWRYRPNVAVPVDDPNNAADGDLLIALALLRAGQRWGSTAYTDAAGCIGADLLRNCVREVGGGVVLLPAAFGFEHPGRVIINPSYYVFPALAALADVVPDPLWERLQADGLRILRRASFGQWRLPADWLEIAHGSLDHLAPAKGWPARFSWDAVRVPLNLAWAGLTDEPSLAAAAEFWTDPERSQLPAWVDLSSGAFAPFAASAGVGAIAQVARATRPGATTPDLPHVGAADDYYSAALVLLSRVVWQERGGVSAA